MRESISISLPAAVRAELDRYVEARGLSRSDAVREAIADYLFVQRLREMRQRLRPLAETTGIFTDEDVFRIVS